MGIQGLLPCLRSITTAVHVSKYAGRRVAVDAYSWLHKGAYSCSRELCEGTPTDKYITYCMDRVRLLRGCGVVPVLVFDGGRLPMKEVEEAARARSRKEHLERAGAHLRAGNAAAANDCFQKAVDISPITAKRFIEVLKREGVEFIVAPYEADAQLAYLAISGDVDAVITEDSDLLAYGCPKVLFKMDRSGECQEIALEDLNINRELNFVGFTPQMFLETCIMAGCDFVKALPGIGMKKAHQHMRRLRSFLRVSKSLRFSCSVPRTYEEDVQRAIWTFRHQRVFCPRARRVVHLRPLPESGLAATAVVPAAAPGDEALEFLGQPLPDAVARQIAAGDLDPITLRPFQPLDQATASPHAQPGGAETQPAGCSIRDYFLPHARVSERATRAFRPPGAALPGSGGLRRDAAAERPAAVAAMHSEGCQSQPEESAAEVPSGGPRPGDARRPVHSGLASTDARSERPRLLALPPPGQRRLDGMLRRGLGAAAEDVGSSAVAPQPTAADDKDGDQGISPARAHPLAGRMRPSKKPRVHSQAQKAAAANAQRPRTPLLDARPRGSTATVSGRVLQELLLPPPDGEDAAAPRHSAMAMQPAAKHQVPDAAAESAPAAGRAAAVSEAVAGFDLRHMRQYAVEASKALDSLKQQRRAPAKGARLLRGADTFAGGVGGNLSSRGSPARVAQQASAAAAARKVIERFKRQIPRPPGQTPQEAAAAASEAQPAAVDPTGTEPADAKPPATPRTTPLQPGSADRSDAPRQRDGRQAVDPFSQGSPRLSFSMVPESPAFLLPPGSGRGRGGNISQSQDYEQLWRRSSSGNPARPACSDPSPSLGAACCRLPLGAKGGSSPSPRHCCRRLSLGAVSQDWLSDPSDDEVDLLATDDLRRLSPGRQLCDGSRIADERLEQRLLAPAPGRSGLAASGRLWRSSNGSRGLAGFEGLEVLDGSDLVEAFSLSPPAGFGMARPLLLAGLLPASPLHSGGAGDVGGSLGAPSPSGCTTREGTPEAGSDDAGWFSAGSQRERSAAASLSLEKDDCDGQQRSVSGFLSQLADGRGGGGSMVAGLLSFNENGVLPVADDLGFSLARGRTLDRQVSSGITPVRHRTRSPARRRDSLLCSPTSTRPGNGGTSAFIADLQRREQATENGVPGGLGTGLLGPFDNQHGVAEWPLDCGAGGSCGGSGRLRRGSLDISSGSDGALPWAATAAARRLPELPRKDAPGTLEHSIMSAQRRGTGSAPTSSGSALWRSGSQPQRAEPPRSKSASDCFVQFAFKRAELSFLTR